MKRNNFYILLVFLPFLFSSCEEEVVLDLHNIEKRLIVEATLTNLDPAVKVSLSYSQAFYDVPDMLRQTNANVTIANSNGESETLVPDTAGFFVSKNLKAQFGETYTLKVEIDQQVVEVSSTMPRVVEIGYTTFVPNPFWGSPDSLNTIVNVMDPKGEDNFFRLKLNKLGAIPSTEFFIVDDSFGKDGIISMPIYYKTFAPGDTVIIELRHLTNETADYYSGLSENVGGSFNSIAPGNPVSNMPDEVYGYFATYAVAFDTVIVQKTIPSF
ncbi:MAG TPA: DUF4249 domain-containing protein [Prolixibacteraceae bacterium]|nr:DUF4249 domain-containing protein [Prolixibacteraceae bacterium]